MAGQLGLISCTFRQTNVVWVLYAYAASQLMYLRFRRGAPGVSSPKKLHDPPALSATPGMCVSPCSLVDRRIFYFSHPVSGDLVRSLLSAPQILVDILPSFIPYTLVVAAFAAFVLYNGGVVLGMFESNERCSTNLTLGAGDKANHIPALHIPQLYYFIAFSTAFGWPILMCGTGGPRKLIQDVWSRMFGGKMYLLFISSICHLFKVTDACS